MADKFSVRDLFNRFADDDMCLEHIMEVRYGLRHDCHRYGDQFYPCAGTIFEDSRTSLQIWFYAIFLFVTTRHGVSGKELECQLGVMHKTAWRMGQQIRLILSKADGFDVLRIHVELDEVYVGGKRSGGKRGRRAPGKTIVFGTKQREGRMNTEVIPNIRKATLHGATLRNVEPGSTVSTDELMSDGILASDGYQHGQVKHRAKECAYYDYH